MRRTTQFAVFVAIGAGLAGGLNAWAQDKKVAPQESERKVKEAEVPKAALDALKKQAGGSALTEFAEEIEHGHKYYEGSYKGPGGNVDVLVTEGGDVVEIEEEIAADKAPGGVRAAAEKEAGKDAKVSWEKKTLYLYEIHFKKDGKGREIIFTADGRRFREEGGDQDEADEDEDEKK